MAGQEFGGIIQFSGRRGCRFLIARSQSRACARHPHPNLLPSREKGFVARDSYLISGGGLARAPRQNQDLRDYGIFRILQARASRLASAHPNSSWRNLWLWRKARVGRIEILKILILTKTRNRSRSRRPRHSREGGNPEGGGLASERVSSESGFSGFLRRARLVWQALIRIRLGGICCYSEKRGLGESKS